jgi:hypothetical protein
MLRLRLGLFAKTNIVVANNATTIAKYISKHNPEATAVSGTVSQANAA